MQKIHNSFANEPELCLFCIKPPIYIQVDMYYPFINELSLFGINS